MKKQHPTRKILNRKRISLIIVVGLIVAGGIYALLRVSAATPSVISEAENGTVSKGAQVVDNSKASGGKSIHFNVPQSSFKSTALTSGADFKASIYLNKGSYGSLTPITNKGYTKYNVLQVADSATTATKYCDKIDTDSKLVWLETTCETFDSDGWRQQGLTGVGGSGYSDRDDVLLFSAHSDDSKQARMTVMNKTTKKQQLVYLGRACDDTDGYCDMASDSGECGDTHVGGLIWYKNYLYAADSNCVIMFNADNIYKLASGKLVLPATGYWKRASTEFELSSMGLDVSGAVPQMLISEYVSTCSFTHFGSFDLDATTGAIVPDNGSTTKATVDTMMYVNDVCKVQGIARLKGMYFLTTSGSGDDYVYRFRTDASAPPDTKFLWPRNTPQNIYVDPVSNVMWSMTEGSTPPDTYARIFDFTTASATE